MSNLSVMDKSYLPIGIFAIASWLCFIVGKFNIWQGLAVSVTVAAFCCLIIKCTHSYQRSEGDKAGTFMSVVFILLMLIDALLTCAAFLVVLVMGLNISGSDDTNGTDWVGLAVLGCGFMTSYALIYGIRSILQNRDSHA